MKGKDPLILEKLPDRSHKPQAPEMLRPRRAAEPRRRSLTKTFEDRRKATMDYIRTANDDLRDHLFDHAAFTIFGGYHSTAIRGCC